MKYSLKKFISPEEVFARVKSSLKSYADMDMILMDEYYKTIDLCNSKLGLRINPKKEQLIAIENYQAELPEDFLLLDLAMVVGTETVSLPYGHAIREMNYEGRIPTPEELSLAANLDKCCNFKLSCGKVPVLTCSIKEHYIEFEQTHIIRLTEKRYCSSSCFNLYTDNPNTMEIIEGRSIQLDHFEDGLLYILYTAKTSSEGNIPLCLDHPKILEYYEKAIKHEILKDLYINKRLEVVQALQLSQQDLTIAQGDAISLVSTPEVYEQFDVNNALKRRYRQRNNFLYNSPTPFYPSHRRYRS